MNLARNVKGNRKGFCKCVSDKSKTGKFDPTAVNEAGPLVTQDVEKDDVPNAAFASVFTSKTVFLYSPHIWENAESAGTAAWRREGSGGLLLMCINI